MSEVRLIDANAAADKIMRETEVHADEIGVGAVAIMIAFARALRDETDFPTIKPEVRHGRWEIINTDANVWKCTTCGDEWMLNDGNPSDNNMLFCPHCGSRMCGGEQE